MKTWRVIAGGGIDGLNLEDERPGPLGPRQVRVRNRATTLNFRDLAVLKGGYPVSTQGPMVPCSDGAGDVVETGGEVTRFRTGDRVVTSFFPGWTEGRVSPARVAGALGGGGTGTLAEEIVVDQDALARIPDSLNYNEAAALTCAGVTAWHALFVTGALPPGGTVLLLGTGGVSVWGLQLAKAAGARVIITSSSDAKLDRARALGADGTINYRSVEKWSAEVRKLTGGEGADLVLEVGGEKTFAESLASTRMGGTIAVIGGVSGFGGAMAPRQLIMGGTRVQGIYVGSRQMLEDLARFVEVAKIRPVIDRVFATGEARDAFGWFAGGNHFGKVAITF